MIEDLNLDSKWSLIIIDDPACLPGKSILNIIQTISKVFKFKFVILDYIYGSANNGLIASFQEQRVLDLNGLFEILPNVVQFDWGDFFLFKEYPRYWDNPKGEFYPYVIAQTDTTIRAVDDQYIYIYTSHEEIVKVIQSHYEIESIKIDVLEKLDYPE